MKMNDAVKSHEAIWLGWKDRKLDAEIARHIAERRPFLDLLVKEAAILKEKTPVPLKTLEMVRGTAIDSYYLANCKEACDAYAVDMSENAIKIAAEIGKRFDRKIRLFRYDVSKMDFPDDYFDIVFSQGLIEHFPDPSRVIAESLRVLKNTGTMVMSVPQRYSLYTVFKKTKMLLGRWERGWEREYALRDFRKMASAHWMDLAAYGGYGSFLKDIALKYFPRAFSGRQSGYGSPYLSKNIFAVFRKKN